MLSKVSTVTYAGLETYRVDVEVDTAFGLPNFIIVGLGATSIQEARERVRSAIRNSGLAFPTHRITVNLAPAQLRKDGASFDLPIAVAVLIASGQLPPLPVTTACFGELSLDGQVKASRGALGLLLDSQRHGWTELFISAANQLEASIGLSNGMTVRPVTNLRQLVGHLTGLAVIKPITANNISTQSALYEDTNLATDFSEIRGQDQAKRGLQIAAAGGHNILLSGPPGTGKTMLVRALPSILPPLSLPESLELTRLYNLSKTGQSNGLLIQRPFRSPHHTTSLIGLVGGGAQLYPGEISLAHHGVLFLDEIPEFPRSSLEALRQPLEDRQLTISRAGISYNYPSDFLLVATANPCPCGYYGSSRKKCQCSLSQVAAYRKHLSGPLLDRIDLFVDLKPVKDRELLSDKVESQSPELRRQVVSAHQRQSDRLGGNRTNHAMTNHEVETYSNCKVPQTSLQSLISHFQLSARAYYRLIKVARTIADLAQSDTIESVHLAEASQYRLQPPA